MATPLLGWIAPQDRTQEQNDAHEAAVKMMPKFALMPPPESAGPVKVILTDFWKDPLVIADVGFEFTGFRQLTGSCVGVSDGDATFTLGAVQRLNPDAPTKAFLPFWPFMYGRTRYLEGDRGQGEGAVDSVMATQNGTEGVLEATQQGLPTFDRSDGLALPSSTEMHWSDGASSTVTAYLPMAAKNTVGSRSVLNSVADIKAAIINGYPVLDGCDNYIGHGTLNGDVALGVYDGRGGHSTCYLGYWDHPTQGPLYLYSNQWDGSTYPTDGSGKGRCTVWVKEATVAKLFSTGGSGGETVALSHLNYLPAQAFVIEWSQL
jgi:hypothetical protein